MKVYRLLRNNQETGPFTVEELLQKGLKPYDLIWVDGKSAAWRYPSEVDAFKQYVAPVEEQPYDRFYKKEEAPQERKPAEKPRIKPKFRIRAESHKIELVEPEVTPTPQYEAPVKKPAEVTAAPVLEAAPAWQEALNDWQTKQPEPARQENIPVKKESTIQFPLSSPEELDETYSENFFRPKQNGNRSRQVLSYAVLAVLAPLLIAGMWFGFRHNDAPEEPASTANITETKESSAKVSPSESANKPMIVEEKQEEGKAVTQVPKTALVSTNKTIAVPEKHIVPPATQPKKNTVPSVANSIPKNNIKTTQVAAVAIPKTTQVKQNQKAAAQLSSNTPATNNAQPVTIAPKPKEDASVAKNNTQPAVSAPANNTPPVPSTKKISSYVDVEQENLPAAPGEKSVRFHVKNLGDAQVDLVVLDLQYFDGRGKLRKGSTMYFKKIPAQNDIAVDAPIVKDADRVSYKVSLLSIEQKGIYIVAD